jgi:hypothetical protein
MRCSKPENFDACNLAALKIGCGKLVKWKYSGMSTKDQLINNFLDLAQYTNLGNSGKFKLLMVQLM